MTSFPCCEALWQLWCHCNPDHNKFVSLSNMGVWKSRNSESGIRNRNGNGNRKRNRNRNRNRKRKRKRNRNSNVKGNRYKYRDIIILILLQFIQKIRKLVWYHASPWISIVMNRKFNVSLDWTLLSHTTNLYSSSYLPLCEFVESEHWKTENIQFPLEFWCPGCQLSRCLLRPLLHSVEVDEVLAGMGIGGREGEEVLVNTLFKLRTIYICLTSQFSTVQYIYAANLRCMAAQ